MRRSSVIMLLTAVVAGLHTLLFPAAPAQLLLAAFLAVLCALPGILLAKSARKPRRAIYANLLGFGDMLCTALPLALLLNKTHAGAGIFCAMHMLTKNLLGGWLLRRDGIRIEKNFLLILAYRQTLAHCGKFPQERHPHENPLFEPARNAQRAMAELLPMGAVLLAMLLRAMGVVPAGIMADCAAGVMYALSAILLLHTAAHSGRIVFPLQPLKIHLLPAILLRTAMIVPPDPTLPDELQRGGADESSVRDAKCIVQWSWMAFVAAIILFIII